jgi:hypothetical protein
VHAVLEKEVMGDVEQVKVETVGKEEMWALRLLKTMTALETLITTGRAVSPSHPPVSVNHAYERALARDSSRGIRGRLPHHWSYRRGGSTRCLPPCHTSRRIRIIFKAAKVSQQVDSSCHTAWAVKAGCLLFANVLCKGQRTRSQSRCRPSIEVWIRSQRYQN